MQDPFLFTGNQVARLLEDYYKHNSLIVAFDFDNTIYDFHKKGYTFPLLVGIIKECISLGFEVFCFTANKDYEFVNKVLTELGINCNINESSVELGSKSKPYFNILLDDRAGLLSAFTDLTTAIRIITKENK